MVVVGGNKDVIRGGCFLPTCLAAVYPLCNMGELLCPWLKPSPPLKPTPPLLPTQAHWSSILLSFCSSFYWSYPLGFKYFIFSPTTKDLILTFSQSVSHTLISFISFSEKLPESLPCQLSPISLLPSLLNLFQSGATLPPHYRYSSPPPASFFIV